jgi:hypothetical protein
LGAYSKVTIRPTADQSVYISRMARELGITNESEAWRLIIDMGIARREEVLGCEDLLRVSANTLTLLRRMASAADAQLITQSKADAEILIQSLTEKRA